MRGSREGRGPRPHNENDEHFGSPGHFGRADHDHDHGRSRDRSRGRGVRGDGPGRPRGARSKRGDIRTALLTVLMEGPGHGYDIMQRVEEKTGGAWRPSPGSVYPTLQLLGDEGFVTSIERDGKRVFEITEAGTAEATRRLEEAGGAPWDLTDDGVGPWQVKESMGLLFLAAKQISMAGTTEQLQQAVAILAEARKKLYLLLSQD
jgi:DNA-binding PadR family transcriptional regulator